jgi:hypothetical protein
MALARSPGTARHCGLHPLQKVDKADEALGSELQWATSGEGRPLGERDSPPGLY